MALRLKGAADINKARLRDLEPMTTVSWTGLRLFAGGVHWLQGGGRRAEVLSYSHLSRSSTALPITQSLSSSDRNGNSSVK